MTEERTNKFELWAAVFLGITAILTALSSFQAGLWDGKQAEQYGKANTEATAAAAERARAIVEMSKDAQIDITAYRLIREDNPTSDQIASYLYTRQLSDAGYKALGLPPEAKKDDEMDDEKVEALQGEILDKAANEDLVGNEAYLKEMMAKSVEINAQSEKTFAEGNEANEISDKFDLSNVIFAVSLFFMGIALVFKTDMRWKVLIFGGLLSFGALIYMVTLKWTF
ncbi:MAG: DUF4337 family protein [Pyrinomonadaceae bacterium]|nr:DUF4337 family protein [Pyrinomonadaceae bacterium]